MPRETITVAQAAAFLGVSQKTIYRHAHAGCLGEVFQDAHGWAALDRTMVEAFACRLVEDIPPRARIGRPPKGTDNGLFD